MAIVDKVFELIKTHFFSNNLKIIEDEAKCSGMIDRKMTISLHMSVKSAFKVKAFWSYGDFLKIDPE